jgi:hypothetical protein
MGERDVKLEVIGAKFKFPMSCALTVEVLAKSDAVDIVESSIGEFVGSEVYELE